MSQENVEIVRRLSRRSVARRPRDACRESAIPDVELDVLRRSVRDGRVLSGTRGRAPVRAAGARRGTDSSDRATEFIDAGRPRRARDSPAWQGRSAASRSTERSRRSGRSATARWSASRSTPSQPKPSKPWGCRSRRCRRRTWRSCARCYCAARRERASSCSEPTLEVLWERGRCPCTPIGLAGCSGVDGGLREAAMAVTASLGVEEGCAVTMDDRPDGIGRASASSVTRGRGDRGRPGTSAASARRHSRLFHALIEFRYAVVRASSTAMAHDRSRQSASIEAPRPSKPWGCRSRRCRRRTWRCASDVEACHGATTRGLSTRRTTSPRSRWSSRTGRRELCTVRWLGLMREMLDAAKNCTSEYSRRRGIDELVRLRTTRWVP